MDADTHKSTGTGYEQRSLRRVSRGLARLRGELGAVALLEVLTAAPLMIATLGAVLSLNMFSVNELDRVESRVQAGATKQQPLNQRAALARMMRDIRQAETFISASGTALHFEAMLKPADGGPVRKRQVQYVCNDLASPGLCLRSEGPPLADGGSLGPEVTVLENVVNPDVFAIVEPLKPVDPLDPGGPQEFNDKPRYATVKLAVAVKHELCPDGAGTGCRNPNPTNPIVLEAGTELPNTKPDSAQSEDDCDFVPEPAGCQ